MNMQTPPIVSAQEWEAARQRLLVKEKELFRGATRWPPSAAGCRGWRWTSRTNSTGPQGTMRLLDLFDGRRQLIIYRAFLRAGVDGWPEHACRGCSMIADHVGNLAHLNARNTTLVFASLASQPDIARVKARMGWQMPWYTITDDFDRDFGVDEWHGTNAFIRDGERVFRTYFINNRGDEALGTTWSFLDMTALGRQEDWEDSPEGYPQPRRTRGGTGTTPTAMRRRNGGQTPTRASATLATPGHGATARERVRQGVTIAGRTTAGDGGLGDAGHRRR